MGDPIGSTRKWKWRNINVKKETKDLFLEMIPDGMNFDDFMQEILRDHQILKKAKENPLLSDFLSHVTLKDPPEKE